jgi:hypothetical protein
MKLILFLGAGVSAPSGLPTAADLMDRIMRDVYHQEESHVYRAGPPTDPALRAKDLTPRIRRLVKILMEHDIRDIKRVGYYPVRRGFRSSGAIYRGGSTYEDIFFLCQQISLWNIGLSDNSLTTPFMEYIERKARGCLSGRTTKARISDLASLGSQACDLIETVVADSLRQEYRVGFDLLHELATAPDIEQLNIVTLNHDTLAEQYLSAHGVNFVDGFGPLDGDVRWSDDRLYDSAKARVQLFKLHGSVDWYRFSGSAKTAMVSGDSALTVKDSSGKRLNAFLRRPSFLSGINKVTWYQRGIYADIHFRFHQLLRSCGHIVMSGYGWGDMAINFQLDKWMDDCDRNRIILLHKTPEKLVNRSMLLESAYDAWTRSGQLVCIRHWLSDTSLNDLQLFFAQPERSQASKGS